MALNSSITGCSGKTHVPLPVSCRPYLRCAGAQNRRTKQACQPPTAVSFDSISFDSELDTQSTEVQEMYKDFDALLETARVKFEDGDDVVAEVYSSDAKGAYVDFGGKQVGWVATSEASMCPKLKAADALKVGDSQEFRIIGSEKRRGDNSVMLLSAKAIQEDVSWKRAVQLMENDIDVKAVITGHNRGGFSVEAMGLSGFLPFSQSISGASDPDAVVGEEVACKILDCDQSMPRFVLSARGAGANVVSAGDFKVGRVVEGVVTSTVTYGAFLDVGQGVAGLLHISQITHGLIPDVSKILKQGDRVKVMVLSYDRIRRKVSLSTKKLEPSPGDMITNPSLVYEKADEMAKKFREQVAIAERRAEEEEKKLSEQAKLEI